MDRIPMLTSLGDLGTHTMTIETQQDLRILVDLGFIRYLEVTREGQKVWLPHVCNHVNKKTGQTLLYSNFRNGQGTIRCASQYQPGGLYVTTKMGDSLGKLIKAGQFKPWGPMWTWATYSKHTMTIPAPEPSIRTKPKSHRPPRPRFGEDQLPPIAKLQEKTLTKKITKKERLSEAYEEPEQLQPNGFLVDMDDNNLAVLSFPLIDEIYELLGRPDIGKMKAVMTVVAQACGYQDWEDAMAKATNDDGHLTKRYIISMGQKGSVKFLPK